MKQSHIELSDLLLFVLFCVVGASSRRDLGIQVTCANVFILTCLKCLNDVFSEYKQVFFEFLVTFTVLQQLYVIACCALCTDAMVWSCLWNLSISNHVSCHDREFGNNLLVYMFLLCGVCVCVCVCVFVCVVLQTGEKGRSEKAAVDGVFFK